MTKTTPTGCASYRHDDEDGAAGMLRGINGNDTTTQSEWCSTEASALHDPREGSRNCAISGTFGRKQPQSDETTVAVCDEAGFRSGVTTVRDVCAVRPD